MFTVAKETAEISTKYYSVVKKAPSKKTNQEKAPKVPLRLPGRKPTKVYRRTDNKRHSVEGN